jgi:hypothetical protein
MSPENKIPEERIGYSHERLNAEVSAELKPETAGNNAPANNAFSHNVQDEDFGYNLEIPPYNPLLD